MSERIALQKSSILDGFDGSLTGRENAIIGGAILGLSRKSIMAKLDAIADLLETTASGFGPLRAVTHAASLSATPARWELPAMPLGHYPPAWR